MPHDAAWRRRLRRRLLGWFDRHARDLPWRRTRDPYAVWISEIMLQQTQVATVVPYFERFLAEFPDVASLAAATEQDVLRLWEGLGYYRRARQMHRAAATIVAQHDGRFPHDRDAVLALPGVGRYTAGAILSIALDAREPILEANSIRLLCRLAAVRDDPTGAATQRGLWSLAEQLLPRRRVGALNQALMELGSLICTPVAPACERCPLRPLCATAALGLQDEIPRVKKKASACAVREVAVVVCRGRDVLLRRCGADGRWAGLWDFPRFAFDGAGGDAAPHVGPRIKQLTGLDVEVRAHLTTIKHTVTRFRITLDCFRADRRAGRLRRDGEPLRWVHPTLLSEFPLNVTGRKIARLLDDIG